MKEITGSCNLESYANGKGKTVLKIIDEYNYTKYTKGWI
jgi:hypothetical protein